MGVKRTNVFRAQTSKNLLDGRYWIFAKRCQKRGPSLLLMRPPHTFKEPKQLKNSSGAVIATATGLQDAIQQLKRIERPFLNWAGKAERLSFDVPTLPLFVHERLSTKAILETLKGHKRDRQFSMFDLLALNSIH